MEIGDERLEQIMVINKKDNDLIVIIHNNKIETKDGYEVKLISRYEDNKEPEKIFHLPRRVTREEENIVAAKREDYSVSLRMQNSETDKYIAKGNRAKVCRPTRLP